MRDEPKCEWIDSHEDGWTTDCGNAFVFNDEGPTENGFKFCPYCGKPLEVAPFGEDALDV